MSRVVRPGDSEWPRRLHELGPHAPPARLYADGLPLPAVPAVAVVGTRRPTAAGLDAARAFARSFAEAGLVVVSGFAVGIDAAAHRAAIDAGGHTIAVLGCGLDVAYPRRNAALRRALLRSGTVVTEYPDGTPPLKHHFPLRNRVIAGLSLGVVVVEGALDSGALVTARLALDANRSVYALPGSVRNAMAEGPNDLVRRSEAQLVTRPEHVLQDLAPELVWRDRTAARRAAAALDATEAAVVALLDDVPVAADRLERELDTTAGRLAVTLARLEVRGLAARRRGGYTITDAGARARGAAAQR
ncbi:MAG TPA: DNA-processing protein DprA [Actinomycetota bacterium]|nr:DNA-processing protein DprA [Actinomycetota bacterium]